MTSVRCRGGVYILILITVAVVTALALGSLALSRARGEEAVLVSSAMGAAGAAQSGLEAGLHLMDSNPAWRRSKSAGDWASNLPVGDAKARIRVEGTGGGAWSSDLFAPVRMTSYGTEGGARSILRVNVGLVGGGVGEHLPLIYEACATGYWPLNGSDSDFADDEMKKSDGEKQGSGSDLLEGAMPGLGESTAPWFEGNAGWLRIPAKSAFDVPRGVSVWFWAEGVSGIQGIVTRDAMGYGAGGHWEIWLEDDVLWVSVQSKVGSYEVWHAGVKARSWTHAVVVVEDSALVLYVDGVLRGTLACAGLITEISDQMTKADIFIGGSHAVSSSGASEVTSPFRGSVCEFALFTKVLNASSVAALHDAYPPPPTLEVLAGTWERVVE